MLQNGPIYVADRLFLLYNRRICAIAGAVRLYASRYMLVLRDSGQFVLDASRLRQERSCLNSRIVSSYAQKWSRNDGRHVSHDAGTKPHVRKFVLNHLLLYRGKFLTFFFFFWLDLVNSCDGMAPVPYSQAIRGQACQQIFSRQMYVMCSTLLLQAVTGTGTSCNLV